MKLIQKAKKNNDEEASELFKKILITKKNVRNKCL